MHSAPTSLLEIQYKIQKAVREKNSDKIPKQVENMIAKQSPLSPLERLSVYQEAFFLRMSACLAEDFIRVKNYLDKQDEDAFDQLVHDFVTAIPSEYSSIAEIGQDFPSFIRNRSEEMYELAMLDWLEFLSFYTEDLNATPLSPQEIEQGRAFCLKLKASTFFFKGQKKYYVSSKASNQSLSVQEISEKEFRCLQEFNQFRDLEQFHAILENSGIDLTKAQHTIASWFSQGILEAHDTLQKNT